MSNVLTSDRSLESLLLLWGVIDHLERDVMDHHLQNVIASVMVTRSGRFSASFSSDLVARIWSVIQSHRTAYLHTVPIEPYVDLQGND